MARAYRTNWKNFKMAYVAGTYIHKVASDMEESRRNKTIREMSNDTKERMRIQQRIQKLKELGFPKEEAVKRLSAEFADSRYKNFFKSWVENAYAKKIKGESPKIASNNARYYYLNNEELEK